MLKIYYIFDRFFKKIVQNSHSAIIVFDQYKFVNNVLIVIYVFLMKRNKRLHHTNYIYGNYNSILTYFIKSYR